MLLKINKLQNIIYYSSGPACSSSNPVGLKPARPEGLPARAAQQQQQRVALAAPLPRAQATTWAWAGIPLARLGSIRPGATLAVNMDPTAERAFRSDKTPTPRAAEETLTSFSSALSLSLPHSTLSSQHSGASHRVRSRRSFGATAPLPAPSPVCALPSG